MDSNISMQLSGGQLPATARRSRTSISALRAEMQTNPSSPTRKRPILSDWSFSAFGYLEGGFERRLLATCRWHVATAVDSPQRSESVLQFSNLLCIHLYCKHLRCENNFIVIPSVVNRNVYRLPRNCSSLKLNFMRSQG